MDARLSLLSNDDLKIAQNSLPDLEIAQIAKSRRTYIRHNTSAFSRCWFEKPSTKWDYKTFYKSQHLKCGPAIAIPDLITWLTSFTCGCIFSLPDSPVLRMRHGSVGPDDVAWNFLFLFSSSCADRRLNIARSISAHQVLGVHLWWAKPVTSSMTM